MIAAGRAGNSQKIGQSYRCVHLPLRESLGLKMLQMFTSKVRYKLDDADAIFDIDFPRLGNIAGLTRGAIVVIKKLAGIVAMAGLATGIALSAPAGASAAQPAPQSVQSVEECGLYTSRLGFYYYNNCWGTGLVRFDYYPRIGPNWSETKCIRGGTEIDLRTSNTNAVIRDTPVAGPCIP